jgi:DNA-binding response OmpR family regulator
VRSTQTILVANENPATRQFLLDNLTADGYEVLSAQDRSRAIGLLDLNHPDLVLVDVNGDTLELLDAVRSADGLAGRLDPDTAMIVLTGDADTLQRVRVLERGGDDVVATPFSYPELRARIAAVLRRVNGRTTPRVIRVGPLTIDARARTVTVGEERVELSAKEYDLLRALAGEPTRVFTRQELLRDVWGFRCQGRTRTLDSHASRLRRKLTSAGATRLVVNVWGVGYRLCDPALLG